MTALEKLARRICWLRFSGVKVGTTEARYWADLPMKTRDSYCEEARRVVWLLRIADERPGTTPDLIRRAIGKFP